MKSTISLMGMYNYQNDIFDTFAIPNGVDKNLLIQNLMVQTAELELLYTDPNVLKTVIGFWSAKELPIWEKLKATTEYDYNPIWNTDREITHTDSTTRTRTRTENVGETEEANAQTTTSDSAESDSDTTSDSSFDGEETTQIAAFNADSMQESQKVTTTNDVEATETNHSESTGNSSGTLESTTTNNRKTDEDEGETVTYMHHEKGHGNIGVTTTQQMIREERDVVKFNIVDYIIEEFTHRFCILVY